MYYCYVEKKEKGFFGSWQVRLLAFDTLRRHVYVSSTLPSSALPENAIPDTKKGGEEVLTPSLKPEGTSLSFPFPSSSALMSGSPEYGSDAFMSNTFHTPFTASPLDTRMARSQSLRGSISPTSLSPSAPNNARGQNGATPMRNGASTGVVSSGNVPASSFSSRAAQGGGAAPLEGSHSPGNALFSTSVNSPSVGNLERNFPSGPTMHERSLSGSMANHFSGPFRQSDQASPFGDGTSFSLPLSLVQQVRWKMKLKLDVVVPFAQKRPPEDSTGIDKEVLRVELKGKQRHMVAKEAPAGGPLLCEFTGLTGERERRASDFGGFIHDRFFQEELFETLKRQFEELDEERNEALQEIERLSSGVSSAGGRRAGSVGAGSSEPFASSRLGPTLTGMGGVSLSSRQRLQEEMGGTLRSPRHQRSESVSHGTTTVSTPAPVGRRSSGSMTFLPTAGAANVAAGGLDGYREYRRYQMGGAQPRNSVDTTSTTVRSTTPTTVRSPHQHNHTPTGANRTTAVTTRPGAPGAGNAQDVMPVVTVLLQFLSEYEYIRFLYCAALVLAQDKLTAKPYCGFPPFDPRNDLGLNPLPPEVWNFFRAMENEMMLLFVHGSVVGTLGPTPTLPAMPRAISTSESRSPLNTSVGSNESFSLEKNGFSFRAVPDSATHTGRLQEERKESFTALGLGASGSARAAAWPSSSRMPGAVDKNAYYPMHEKELKEKRLPLIALHDVYLCVTYDFILVMQKNGCIPLWIKWGQTDQFVFSMGNERTPVGCSLLRKRGVSVSRDVKGHATFGSVSGRVGGGDVSASALFRRGAERRGTPSGLSSRSMQGMGMSTTSIGSATSSPYYPPAIGEGLSRRGSQGWGARMTDQGMECNLDPLNVSLSMPSAPSMGACSLTDHPGLSQTPPPPREDKNKEGQTEAATRSGSAHQSCSSDAYVLGGKNKSVPFVGFFTDSPELPDIVFVPTDVGGKLSTFVAVEEVCRIHHVTHDLCYKNLKPRRAIHIHEMPYPNPTAFFLALRLRQVRPPAEGTLSQSTFPPEEGECPRRVKLDVDVTTLRERFRRQPQLFSAAWREAEEERESVQQHSQELGRFFLEARRIRRQQGRVQPQQQQQQVLMQTFTADGTQPVDVVPGVPIYPQMNPEVFPVFVDPMLFDYVTYEFSLRRSVRRGIKAMAVDEVLRLLSDYIRAENAAKYNGGRQPSASLLKGGFFGFFAGGKTKKHHPHHLNGQGNLSVRSGGDVVARPRTISESAESVDHRPHPTTSLQASFSSVHQPSPSGTSLDWPARSNSNFLSARVEGGGGEPQQQQDRATISTVPSGYSYSYPPRQHPSSTTPQRHDFFRDDPHPRRPSSVSLGLYGSEQRLARASPVAFPSPASSSSSSLPSVSDECTEFPEAVARRTGLGRHTTTSSRSGEHRGSSLATSAQAAPPPREVENSPGESMATFLPLAAPSFFATDPKHPHRSHSKSARLGKQRDGEESEWSEDNSDSCPSLSSQSQLEPFGETIRGGVTPHFGRGNNNTLPPQAALKRSAWGVAPPSSSTFPQDGPLTRRKREAEEKESARKGKRTRPSKDSARSKRSTVSRNATTEGGGTVAHKKGDPDSLFDSLSSLSLSSAMQEDDVLVEKEKGEGKKKEKEKKKSAISSAAASTTEVGRRVSNPLLQLNPVSLTEKRYPRSARQEGDDDESFSPQIGSGMNLPTATPTRSYRLNRATPQALTGERLGSEGAPTEMSLDAALPGVSPSFSSLGSASTANPSTMMFSPMEGKRKNRLGVEAAGSPLGYGKEALPPGPPARMGMTEGEGEGGGGGGSRPNTARPTSTPPVSPSHGRFQGKSPSLPAGKEWPSSSRAASASSSQQQRYLSESIGSGRQSPLDGGVDDPFRALSQGKQVSPSREGRMSTTPVLTSFDAVLPSAQGDAAAGPRPSLHTTPTHSSSAPAFVSPSNSSFSSMERKRAEEDLFGSTPPLSVPRQPYSTGDALHASTGRSRRTPPPPLPLSGHTNLTRGGGGRATGKEGRVEEKGSQQPSFASAVSQSPLRAVVAISAHESSRGGRASPGLSFGAYDQTSLRRAVRHPPAEDLPSISNDSVSFFDRSGSGCSSQENSLDGSDGESSGQGSSSSSSEWSDSSMENSSEDSVEGESAEEKEERQAKREARWLRMTLPKARKLYGKPRVYVRKQEASGSPGRLRGLSSDSARRYSLGRSPDSVPMMPAFDGHSSPPFASGGRIGGVSPPFFSAPRHRHHHKGASREPPIQDHHVVLASHECVSHRSGRSALPQNRAPSGALEKSLPRPSAKGKEELKKSGDHHRGGGGEGGTPQAGKAQSTPTAVAGATSTQKGKTTAPKRPSAHPIASSTSSSGDWMSAVDSAVLSSAASGAKAVAASASSSLVVSLRSPLEKKEKKKKGKSTVRTARSARPSGGDPRGSETKSTKAAKKNAVEKAKENMEAQSSILSLKSKPSSRADSLASPLRLSGDKGSLEATMSNSASTFSFDHPSLELKSQRPPRKASSKVPSVSPSTTATASVRDRKTSATGATIPVTLLPPPDGGSRSDGSPSTTTRTTKTEKKDGEKEKKTKNERGKAERPVPSASASLLLSQSNSSPVFELAKGDETRETNGSSTFFLSSMTGVNRSSRTQSTVVGNTTTHSAKTSTGKRNQNGLNTASSASLSSSTRFTSLPNKNKGTTRQGGAKTSEKDRLLAKTKKSSSNQTSVMSPIATPLYVSPLCHAGTSSSSSSFHLSSPKSSLPRESEKGNPPSRTRPASVLLYKKTVTQPQLHQTSRSLLTAARSAKEGEEEPQKKGGYERSSSEPSMGQKRNMEESASLNHTTSDLKGGRHPVFPRPQDTNPLHIASTVTNDQNTTEASVFSPLTQQRLSSELPSSKLSFLHAHPGIPSPNDHASLATKTKNRNEEAAALSPHQDICVTPVETEVEEDMYLPILSTQSSAPLSSSKKGKERSSGRMPHFLGASDSNNSNMKNSGIRASSRGTGSKSPIMRGAAASKD